MKIKDMRKPSRTTKSYDTEASMLLFVPPGNKTSNWYVRVYVPTDLLAVYGQRAEIRQSTRTKDKVLAQARAAVFLGEKSAEFLRVRQAMSARLTPRASVATVLSRHAIEHIAAIRLASLIGFDDEMRDGHGDDDWDEHDEFIESRLSAMKQLLARKKGAKDYAVYRREFLSEVEQYGYAVSASDPLLDELIMAMVRADKRALELMAKRNTGDETPEDVPVTGNWLSEVLADWSEHGVAHLDGRKTVSSYRSRVQHFIEFVHDKPLAQVTQSDIYDWLRHLLHVEQHAYKTITDGYLPALRSVIHYAISSGKHKLQADPTQGVKVPKLNKRELKSREKPRSAFPVSYVNALFGSQWYAGLNQRKGLISKIHDGGGARYWVPLIGLTQGIRPEEISQMTLLDVGVQDGVLSIQVSDEGDRQHTKNDSTKRWVPVHPHLISLGFTDYIEQQRKQQNIPAPIDAFREKLPGQKTFNPKHAGRLFPSLATKNSHQANAFGKAFNRYIRNVLKFESEFVFYSFRHLWEDSRRIAMSKAASEGKAWPPGLHFQLSGRANSAREADEGSASEYGHGFTPSAMAPYIAQINFPNLSLPPKWADFQKQ